VRFLIDRCAGRRIAEWLRLEGHDVIEARELGQDPGDQVLLSLAAGEGRVLVTLDKHFGQHIFLAERKHSGLVRLPDVPAAERTTLMKQVLESHSKDLADAKVVTVRGSRIRVSDPPRGLALP
jgi:predicted nuclease of predicted toxin-antitoxin system